MILSDGKFFDPDKIADSGQVLLGWKKEKDGTYLVRSLDKSCTVSVLGKTGDKSLVLPEDSGRVLISCPDSDNPFWSGYFDLQTDYEKIENSVPFNAGREDAFLSAALEYGRGIRILRQDLWEALCSFIISQNNNIPRITKSIERIEEGLGHFPDPMELYERRDMLRSCGLGYRDEYLIRLSEEIYLGKRSLVFSKDTLSAEKELRSIYGVGPKVAACVLLFGLHRMECCPVDTWMKKVFELHYGGKKPEWTQSMYAGYYQQVTFFYERTEKV